MTSSKSLRMLFSLSLFLILCVPFAIAVQPESEASTEPVAPAVSAPSAPAAPTAAPAVRCGRCGDGQCVKSCGETALSCPVDCGGNPQPSASKCTSPADTKAQPKDGDGK